MLGGPARLGFSQETAANSRRYRCPSPPGVPGENVRGDTDAQEETHVALFIERRGEVRREGRKGGRD